MTWSKRLLDVILALVLSVLLFVPFVMLLLVLLLIEGRPLFYVSERMMTPDRAFALIKLRTMRASAGNTGVTGGDKEGRISPTYKALRKSRFDEVPQLLNVLRGQMSFVGPRPPLRIYVEDFPTLYAQVLRNRPGITGLASLRFHAHEEMLLAKTTTAAQTDHVYRTRCVPRKAILDLIYQRHQSFCFDLALIWETATRVLRRR
ncbi:sugar transferase [Loktanella sp. F6476L]|uniref:sugar transferase n=1 Tax=Loktanella sp. F6476L TaxID=2926405 RepID=UPI001FF291D8|nr:sugar transferase [Loktanella sp. F6476L]MCK0122137.1 sugar transferase [Loktanella sp. F6476L]